MKHFIAKPAVLGRTLIVGLFVGVLLLAAAPAGAASVSFVGEIDTDGFFPPGPDGENVGAPVVGSFTYDATLAPDSTTPTSATYVDPAGVYDIAFGNGGSLGTFSNAGVGPLNLTLTSVPATGTEPAFTSLVVGGFASGDPDTGTGVRASVRFRLSDTSSLSPPTSLVEADLLPFDLGGIGRGSLTDEVGLTTFRVTAVPEPTAAATFALIAAFALRRRRR